MLDSGKWWLMGVGFIMSGVGVLLVGMGGRMGEKVEIDASKKLK